MLITKQPVAQSRPIQGRIADTAVLMGAIIATGGGLWLLDVVTESSILWSSEAMWYSRALALMLPLLTTLQGYAMICSAGAIKHDRSTAWHKVTTYVGCLPTNVFSWLFTASFSLYLWRTHRSKPAAK